MFIKSIPLNTTPLTISCSITGISLVILSPFFEIKGYSLSYNNPLAYGENFKPIALLPLSTLVTMDKSILAGVLLAIMKRRELLALSPKNENPSCLTSVEQNILLQELAPLYLVDLIKFFIPITRKQALLIPKIALSPKQDSELQKSSLKDLLKNYKSVVTSILYNYVSCEKDKEQKEINLLVGRAERMILGKISSANLVKTRAIEAARKTRETRQEELLLAGRKLVKQLSIASNLSDKLQGFIKVLFQGQTLLTIEPSVKERISTALQKHEEDILALELSKIIMNPIMTLEKESLFPSMEVRTEQEEISTEVTSVEQEQKKLSLKERLLLIKNRSFITMPLEKE